METCKYLAVAQNDRWQGTDDRGVSRSFISHESNIGNQSWNIEGWVGGGGSLDREEVKGVPRRRHISLNNLKKSPSVSQVQCFGSQRILHPQNTTSLHDDVQHRLSAQPLHSCPCTAPPPLPPPHLSTPGEEDRASTVSSSWLRLCGGSPGPSSVHRGWPGWRERCPRQRIIFYRKCSVNWNF